MRIFVLLMKQIILIKNRNMKEISSNAVHNFTVRLRAVSEFIDSMSVSDVRKVMSTQFILPLGTNNNVLKKSYSYNNDKDEINFKIWFLNTVKQACPSDMYLTFDDAMEMTWCMLLHACRIIY